MTKTIDLAHHHTAAIVTLYNDCAFEMGERPVTRFADRPTAIKRTQAIFERRARWREEKEAELARKRGEDLEAVKANPAMISTRQAAAQAIATGDAGRGPTPPVAAPRERWRRAKRHEPGRTAYRPRAGSLQASMYGLLTQPGGITVEAFCAAMTGLPTKDRSFLNPPGVWAGLVYLFCSQKGYGLELDGEGRLRLLVPADEREAGR